MKKITSFAAALFLTACAYGQNLGFFNYPADDVQKVNILASDKVGYTYKIEKRPTNGSQVTIECYVTVDAPGASSAQIKAIKELYLKKLAPTYFLGTVTIPAAPDKVQFIRLDGVDKLATVCVTYIVYTPKNNFSTL
jgi:hypothetical protein